MLKPVSTSKYCCFFFFFARPTKWFLALILFLHLFSEKVNVPLDKPKILLEGESRTMTIIQFGEGGDSIKGSTFSLYAKEFVAKDITFKVK